jgi:hypothetical protein
MAIEELSQAEATILKLEPGDILILKFSHEMMDDPGALRQTLEAIDRTIEAAGHAGHVGVLLTADAIEMTVVRAP